MSTTCNAGRSAQRDTNQTSGRRWLHNVGQHLSLFVNGVKDKIALKLIAAQGKVQVQAQHGEMEITAENDLTFTAAQGKVTIAGKEEILLTSGGGYIRIKDGNIEIHCPDLVSMRAAKHPWTGPDSMRHMMPEIPRASTRYDEQFQALDLTGTKPIANLPFRVAVGDGRVIDGITDHEGKTPRIYGPTQHHVDVTWGGLIEGLIEEGEDHTDECC